MENRKSTLKNSMGRRTNIRWIVAAMMWAAIAINYIDRTVLSTGATHISKEFSLSSGEMGILMSAFFWSYALLQIPAGWVADRIGQKRTLGFAVGWCWLVVYNDCCNGFSSRI